MPEAIAEPPVADIAQSREPIQFNMSEALARISKDRIKGTQEEKPEKPVVEEPKKVEPVAEPEKKEEPKVEEKKAEPVVEKKEEPVVPEIKHNAGHFKVVVERAEKAEARIKEVETELEQARKTPPPEITTKLTDFEKRAAEAERERDELRAKVREVDVTLDPAYQEQFVKPIQANMQEVFKYLVDSGVDKKEASDLVAAWDLKGISAVSGDMDEVSKQLMMATIRDTISIDKERQKQIKSPEDFAARRRQAQEQEQKQFTSERVRIVAEIEQKLYESTPVLLEAEHEEFRNEMKNGMTRAATAQMSPREILGYIAQAHALPIAVRKQHEVIVSLTSENEELKKKLAEQDKFIAGGALPKGEATGGGEGEYVPLVKSLRVA